MRRVRRRLRLLTVLVVVLGGTLALGIAAANRFAGPLPPRRLVMSTGREDGAYYAFAGQYREVLAEQGFALDIVPGPGSIETLRRLRDGTADTGFVQGGTTGGVDTTGLTALASVFYEPLWVFHRRGLRLIALADLKGRRLAVGERGSGTRALALRLLADNGVGESNATLREVPTRDVQAAFTADAIDAAFFVASPRAPVIRALLADPALSLMSERRDTAYRSLHPFLMSVRIGEGMVDMANNLPREDKVLLAAAASLVVRDTVHPDWVRLLLFAATRVHREATRGDPAGTFPTEAYTELPVNEQAVRYLRTGPSWLERRFPFWLAGILDRLLLIVLPALTMMFPLFGLILPMLDRRHRMRIARWYAALRDIEQRCRDAGAVEIAPEIERLRRLHHDIARRVDTPLLHLGELYHLKMHVEQTLAGLEQRRARLETEGARRHA